MRFRRVHELTHKYFKRPAEGALRGPQSLKLGIQNAASIIIRLLGAHILNTLTLKLGRYNRCL